MMEGLPTYEKLACQLQADIQNGVYAPGEKLPAERALSMQWGVSRGTVKNALSILAQKGVLVQRQGSGTFVADGVLVRESGQAYLRDTLQTLMDLQLTGSEIAGMFFREAWARLDEKERYTLAFVGAVPELLEVEAQSLEESCGLRVRAWLMEDLKPQEMRRFHMVAATNACYPKLEQLLKGTAARPLQVVFSPSVDTIRALAPLPKGATLRLVYQSKLYLRLTQKEIRELAPGVVLLPVPLQQWRPEEEDADCVLLPPGVSKGACLAKALHFSVALDRGSVALLLEQGRKCLEESLAHTRAKKHGPE